MAKINGNPENKQVETKEESTQSVNLKEISEILQRLENLESENKALKEGKENTFTKAKKIYEGPRHYSYKMWGGIPVLSYVSTRKDSTKDYLYKNQFGEMTSNHLLELTLANETKVKVEVNEFNSAFTRSEKVPCEVITDGYNAIGYKFKDAEYGEFVVNPNIIN